MAGITLEQAQTQLAAYLAASEKISQNQSYEIDTGNGRRKLTRADLAEVQKSIEFWDRKVKELTPAATGGKRRTRFVVPR